MVNRFLVVIAENKTVTVLPFGNNPKSIPGLKLQELHEINFVFVDFFYCSIKQKWHMSEPQYRAGAPTSTSLPGLFTALSFRKLLRIFACFQNLTRLSATYP